MEVRFGFLSQITIHLILLLYRIDFAYLKQGCDIYASQSSTSIIIDIEESRGTQKNQVTSPAELPIVGDPYTEISLSLNFPKGNNTAFALKGKRLELIEPLDRDWENLSHIIFQLSCYNRLTLKKKIIPVIVRVSDINDNAPKFINTPYSTTVSELTPIGTTIFHNLKAVDADAGVNGMVEYFIIPANTKNNSVTVAGKDRINVADGYGYFAINLPHQGQVTINRSLDYEKIQRYFVTIVASDRAKNQHQRLTSTTTLTVDVKDDDDQNPTFVYKGCHTQNEACVNAAYFSTVSSGSIAGVLSIQPEKIRAIDMDSTNAPIRYSFLNSSLSTFGNYFEIDSQTATVKQIKPVNASHVKKIDIIVKAEELSHGKRFATAKLTINVKPVDTNPPVITASAFEGFVDENVPIGTKVVDSRRNAIRVTVIDADSRMGSSNMAKADYIFQLTTTSFAIDDEGILLVNEKNLDRDPPNPGKLKFQIFAREKNGNAASAPITVVVILNDVNDNAPRFHTSVPTITLQAGETRRQIYKVEATDNDNGENAVVTYSIFHISDNGVGKFVVDPKTGLIESVGKFSAGEQYSITVQATDTGGKYSQIIVEVIVIPGPNTKSPVFQQSVYDVIVSEGVPINTTVTSIHAVDPEGRPVSYSIISGNELGEFGINVKTGIIFVVRKLDREQLTRYQLIIKAEDEDGLSSTATVNIKVNDVNDKNPDFTNISYEFSVVEGKEGAFVGQLKAIDDDEGENAVVRYSLPDHLPFIVDVNTGDIRTTSALDYEKQQEYKFVVTAADGAADRRLATATVTIRVTDIEDELPTFRTPIYEVRVRENVADFLVVRVEANDADTVKKITYIIKQGAADLFAIDSSTGLIKTIKGLDYEKETQHTLIVSTKENTGNSIVQPGTTTKVIVNVEDVNDIAPVFVSIPQPIILNDDVPVGSKITSLLATDSDGTAPNNKIRYEIIGGEKASEYFQIDADFGTVRLRNDLREEGSDNEYQIDVKAHDLGKPQLSSVVAVAIFIKRTVTIPPEIDVGFADDTYTVQIPENSTSNALVKSFTIINTSTSNRIGDTAKMPIRCTISSGNSENIFYTNVTTDSTNCELRIKDAKLDREYKNEFKLELHLDVLISAVNVAKNKTSVTVGIIDVNDNVPIFIYSKRNERFAKQAYYGAVARDTQISSSVIKITAFDKDSMKFGQIEYSFIKDDDSKAANYFFIDPTIGTIKTIRSLDGVNDNSVPFRLVVEARDNPSAPAFESNKAEAHVVINLIDDRHRMVLVINDARPDVVTNKRNEIIDILEEHAKLIIGIEKITSRQFQSKDNVTLQVDANSADIWFYVVDPDTELILDRNDSRVTRYILEEDAISNITLDVNENLHASASTIHAPLTAAATTTTTIHYKTPITQFQLEMFPYALILIAALILVSSSVGIIYICISWSKYKAYKERMSRMYLTPRYDPVFVEPNLKEYETQVLQMSVPVDDNDSYNDLQIDFSRKNHTFNIDNVGYISKNNGNRSPTNSDAATTTRASSMSEHHNGGSGGKINRAYQRHAEEDASPTSNITSTNTSTSISATNENVTFREKRDYSTQLGFNYVMDGSSIETTTEL